MAKAIIRGLKENINTNINANKEWPL